MTENIDPELKEICTHAKLLLPMLSDKTFVPNDADVRRAVERQVSAKRLDSGSELVYPPDTSPLICVQFKNAPLDSPDVLALTDRLNKVRADVAGCLEQNHIGVVRFLQEAPATIGKPNRWTPLASHASRAGKVVERIGEGLRAPLIHPNISDETHRLVEDRRLLTIARDYTGVPTLEETHPTVAVDKRIEALRDAMIACKHMHDQGLVHLDIKPGNILVLTDGDDTKGLINDLETTVKIGHPADDLARSGLHSQDFYYHMEFGAQIRRSDDTPASPARDVFAFGISLLMTCAKDASIEKDLESVIAKNTFGCTFKWQRESNLVALINRLELSIDPQDNYKIRRLITRMVKLKESDRVSLAEAINAL